MHVYSSHIKLYELNMYNFLYVNHTSKKCLKKKADTHRALDGRVFCLSGGWVSGWMSEGVHKRTFCSLVHMIGGCLKNSEELAIYTSHQP